MKSLVKYVLGVDFGTDAVRAVLVDDSSGEVLRIKESRYEKWANGDYCVPKINQYRQHPQDYIDSLINVISQIKSSCSEEVIENISAISFDTTGSTLAVVDENGIPLAMHPEFENNPNAMFILWKDHTAKKEANDINNLAEKSSVDYLKYSGGIYSTEWVWSKLLHVLRKDSKVRSRAYSFVEHCDWMPALLTGKQHPSLIKRSRCAAGHKAMWHEEWGGFPPAAFFSQLDPVLGEIANNLLPHTYTSDCQMGELSREWSDKLGLGTHVKIGVGILDAHAGAIGGGIRQGTLVKVMGTSTCDILISSKEELNDKLIQGVCGQVDGAVLPDYIGIEAGQSAYGDIFAWFKDLLLWPIKKSKGVINMEQFDSDSLLLELSREAQSINVTERDLVATDWLNGRRTPDANHELKATITGLDLGITPPMVFKSLVEAAAYGSRAIIDRIKSYGVYIEEIIAVGGVAKKSPYVIQTLANVLGLPIKVYLADESCALGSAILATVVSGKYNTVDQARNQLAVHDYVTFEPEDEKIEIYNVLYEKYRKLGALKV